MATKKHMRKSRRQRKNKSRRQYKRGGGLFDFFRGTASVAPNDCDPMKLTQLTSSEEMRNKYQQCCPKKYFGMVKNNTPYCKQLDLNFKSAVEREGMQKQYVGVEPDEVAQMQNAPMLSAPAPAMQMDSPVVGGKKRRMRKTRRIRRNRSSRK